MTSRKKRAERATEDFETMATTLATTAPYGDYARHGERVQGEVTAAVSGALPTERVRELYGAAVRWDADERFASVRDSNLAEFDAWLAQHDAEVRTAALAAVLPEAVEPYLVEWATEVDALGTKEVWDSEAEARYQAERYGRRLFRVEWTEVEA